MTDIECLVQDGTLKKYRARNGPDGQKRNKRKQGRNRGTCAPPNDKKPRKDSDEGDDEPQYAGEIKTIIDVQHGTTRSSLKAEARSPQPNKPSHKRLKKNKVITFSDDDPVPTTTPHNDAIVIQVGVANQLVHRVYVDTGASVSILFKDCLDKMHLRDARLTPAPLPLKSSAQEEMRPEGVISLPVTAGRPPKSATHVIQFFVVRASSPYNIILGRDWLNAVKAVCSTYHLMLKFPTQNGVAVLRGDQKKAKECMQIALKGKDGPGTVPQA